MSAQDAELQELRAEVERLRGINRRMGSTIAAQNRNVNDWLAQATKVSHVGQLTPGLVGSVVCLTTTDTDGFPMLVRGTLTELHAWSDGGTEGIQMGVDGHTFDVTPDMPCTLDEQDQVL